MAPSVAPPPFDRNAARLACAWTKQSLEALGAAVATASLEDALWLAHELEQVAQMVTTLETDTLLLADERTR